MTKEMRALLQELETLKASVRALIGENKVDEAEKKMEEVRALQKKIDLQKQLEEMDGVINLDAGTQLTAKVDKDLNAEYKRIFLRGLRRQPISADDRSIINEYYKANSIRSELMHEGTDPNNPAAGNVGLIIPQDIQTRINEIMRELNDLSEYITVETVNTLSGSRVLEADNTMTPFQVVNEYGPIQETDNPQFVPITYQLVKRAGYLPLTNELLSDSDQNILNYVARWIAKKHVVTKNSPYHGTAPWPPACPVAGFDDVSVCSMSTSTRQSA